MDNKGLVEHWKTYGMTPGRSTVSNLVQMLEGNLKELRKLIREGGLHETLADGPDNPNFEIVKECVEGWQAEIDMVTTCLADIKRTLLKAGQPWKYYRLRDLEDGMVVRYRLGRAGREATDWQEWTEGPIHVARRARDFKRGKEFERAGTILTLTPKRDGWAEYHERDYCPRNEFHPYGVFLAEDYYMEIDGLVPDGLDGPRYTGL